MRKFAIGLAILLCIVAVGWQIASAELSNIELHDDLSEIAAQNSSNIGLAAPKTDDQVREDVVSAAAECGIHLQPDDVRLQRITITRPYSVNITRFELAVSYTTHVRLLLWSFDLHFDQTSAK